MFRGILPKEFAFYDYFDNHIALCGQLCREFLNLTEGKVSLADGVKKIKDFERQMDQICVQCLEALHNTFITPIERTDILKLIKRLDSIADSVYRAVARIALYELQVRPDIKLIAEILIKSCDELAIALKAMRDFKDPETIKAKCRAVRELESQGDEVFKKAISAVFKEGDAISIIKWKEIYEKLEKAVNRCEDSANLIEEILIESA
jgi:uncharacterized protein Yka (UPF0111/DUF47 family)